jgi:hypothetical protein
MHLLEECHGYCPYCGESISLVIDTSVDEQSYIEDCEVCCRPMVVQIIMDESGGVSLSLFSENELH